MTLPLTPEELAERLDTAALAFGGPWWWCPTFDAVRRQRSTEPVVVALTGMAEMMRSGEDPDWVAGGESARAAVNKAGEWLEAGVGPTQLANWLRAGCHRPQAALEMAAAGVDVRLLLDGAMLTTRTGNANVWSYPNIHGDVVATANQSGAKQGATNIYEPPRVRWRL
jgi:hypothetical protein